MRNGVIISICIIFLSCGKGSNQDVPENAVTGKTTLSAPTNNECLQVEAQLDNTGIVTFSWENAPHAKIYQLVVNNLVNGEQSTLKTENAVQKISLSRDFPYTWYVVAYGQNPKDSTISETNKFYLAGEVPGYSTPFPADSLIPSMGTIVLPEHGQISLGWKGQDVDKDIVGYDVYLGENSRSLKLLKENVAMTYVENVEVQTGNVYYWKIITKDSKGNSSDSGIYQFFVVDNG